MKIFIILIIVCLFPLHLLMSQSLDLEAVYNDYHYVSDVKQYDSELLFITDRSYNGTLWKSTIENCVKLDSVSLKLPGGFIKISPDKNIICVSNVETEIFNALTLEKILDINSNSVYFKNNTELIFLNDEGIFMLNLDNFSVDTIFTDIPYDSKFIGKKLNRKHDMYSSNLNYIILGLEATQGKFVYIIDIINKRLLKVLKNSFSPTINNYKNEIIFNHFGNVSYLKLEEFDNEPIIIDNYPTSEPSTIKYTEDGKYMLSQGASVYYTDTFERFSGPQIQGWNGEIFEQYNLYFVMTQVLVQYNINENTNSVSYLQNINIYPNPLSNKIVLEFNSSISESATLKIINLNGDNVITKDTIINEGFNNFNIDLKDYHSGVYFLNITSANLNIIRTIIKE